MRLVTTARCSAASCRVQRADVAAECAHVVAAVNRRRSAVESEHGDPDRAATNNPRVGSSHSSDARCCTSRSREQDAGTGLQDEYAREPPFRTSSVRTYCRPIAIDRFLALCATGIRGTVHGDRGDLRCVAPDFSASTRAGTCLCHGVAASGSRQSVDVNSFTGTPVSTGAARRVRVVDALAVGQGDVARQHRVGDLDERLGGTCRRHYPSARPGRQPEPRCIVGTDPQRSGRRRACATPDRG